MISITFDGLLWIQACKGISGIYSTRVASVPENDISQLLTVRSRVSEVTVGTMARVKNGKYKGDLAQVEFSNLGKDWV